MSVFSSNRERRLWLLLLAVVAAIFSTLATASSLAGMLRQHGLLEVSFAVGAALVGSMIIIHALKSRPDRARLAITLGVIAAYSLVFVRMANPAERTHLIEYGVVAILAYEALSERARNGRRVFAPPLLAILLASLIGVADEVIQSTLPSRVFDERDILFNVLASVMAVSSSAALSWSRQRLKAGHRSK